MRIENIKNEMGVIAKFSQEVVSTDWEIVRIRKKYPDCIIKNKITNLQLKVEFEFILSNFNAHGHDINECDLIVCLENNIPNQSKNWPVNIWELKDDSWKNSDIVTFDEKDKLIFSLKDKLERAESEIRFLKDKIFSIPSPVVSISDEELTVFMDKEGNSYYKRRMGRPLIPLDKDIIKTYCELGPKNVTRSMAAENFGLSQRGHEKHVRAAFELINSKNKS